MESRDFKDLKVGDKFITAHDDYVWEKIETQLKTDGHNMMRVDAYAIDEDNDYLIYTNNEHSSVYV